MRSARQIYYCESSGCPLHLNESPPVSAAARQKLHNQDTADIRSFCFAIHAQCSLQRASAFLIPSSKPFSPGHFIQRASALLIRTTDPCRKATGEQRASALLISILASGEQRASALSILTASLSPQLYVQWTPALLIKAAILNNL